MSESSDVAERMVWLLLVPSEAIPAVIPTRLLAAAVVAVRGLVVAVVVRVFLEVLLAVLEADEGWSKSVVPTKTSGLPPPTNPPASERFVTSGLEEELEELVPTLLIP